MSDDLFIVGTANVSPPEYDIYIASTRVFDGSGASVSNTLGTVLTAKVYGEGTTILMITVKNISESVYVYEKTIDGTQVGIEGVYSGSEITYEVQNLYPMYEVEAGGTCTFFVTITAPADVTTDNFVLKFNFVEKFGAPGDVYFPSGMPIEEVSIVQRLSNILNNKYQTATVTNSREYLLEETIKLTWGGGDYYVGSMDNNECKQQINELFGDMLNDNSVSFILKNQDLNWDGYNEITIYSTSDPLDSDSEYPSGVVCTYISVFTPVIDDQKNIIGYTLVCEALRGYCAEVRYAPNDLTYSFSTDDWRDDVGYWHYDEVTYASYVCSIPADAMSLDGTKPLREDFASYNLSYNYGEGRWGATAPFGNRLWQCLDGKIPYLY